MKTFLVNEDEDSRRQDDHVDTMRRPKKAKETLALLHKGPWEGCQAIRSTRNPNAIVKSLACGAKSKKRKKK